MTHNCGRPDDECTCITRQEFESCSPNIQRIIRNAQKVLNAQASEGSDKDLDMVPPAPTYAEIGASQREEEGRDLTFNRAEVDEGVRRLWAAADGPCADV